jgi:hypothetical protein
MVYASTVFILKTKVKMGPDKSKNGAKKRRG